MRASIHIWFSWLYSLYFLIVLDMIPRAFRQVGRKTFILTCVNIFLLKLRNCWPRTPQRSCTLRCSISCVCAGKTWSFLEQTQPYLHFLRQKNKERKKEKRKKPKTDPTRWSFNLQPFKKRKKKERRGRLHNRCANLHNRFVQLGHRISFFKFCQVQSMRNPPPPSTSLLIKMNK